MSVDRYKFVRIDQAHWRTHTYYDFIEDLPRSHFYYGKSVRIRLRVEDILAKRANILNKIGDGEWRLNRLNRLDLSGTI